jgi:hypothetical protein
MAFYNPIKRMFVRLNSAGTIYKNGQINFIGGNGIAFSGSDGYSSSSNSNDELDLTVRKGPVSVEAHTADDTLLAAETGSIHTNGGAAGAVILTLPAAAAGLEFDFYVDAAQTLTIDAAAGDTIQVGTGAAGSSGGTLSADAVGESISLVAINDSEWVTKPGTAAVGTWTAA